MLIVGFSEGEEMAARLANPYCGCPFSSSVPSGNITFWSDTTRTFASLLGRATMVTSSPGFIEFLVQPFLISQEGAFNSAAQCTILPLSSFTSK
jgi:hypothetical protein